MRILLTTDTYFPMVNGVVTSIDNLYKELKNLGHDVKIMTLSQGQEESVVGDIYYLKSIKVNIYPDARIKKPFSTYLTKKIIEWKPEIIHSQTEFSTMIVAKYIAKKLSIPHLHTYHTMYEDYLKYILGGKLIKRSAAAKITRILLNTLDGILVPTKKVEEALLGYNIKVNTYIVPTGIDLSKFKNKILKEEKEKLLKRHNLSKSDRILTYVGRIAEEKNIREIIEFFCDIAKEIENSKLLIVGGGPYLEVLKDKAKELNILNRVVFTGMISPSEVYKYYQLGEVFVTASTSETQGLTYIEALSSGLPVVCRYDLAIEGLIINRENGFSYNNSFEFSSAIKETLLNNDLRIKMIENAKLKAEEYSSKSFGSKIEKIYNSYYTKISKYKKVG